MAEPAPWRDRSGYNTAGATFLLVHGAFHDKSCWDRLVPLLEQRGHVAEAIDLPYPPDPQASSSLLLDLWTHHLVERALAYRDPVILVGHSRAGLVISQAAESIPDHVEMLVYCAAMIARSGETTADLRARLGVATSAPLDIRIGSDGISLVADAASVADMIYSNCIRADALAASARLRPEPPGGFKIAPSLTHGQFGSVRKAMIECLHDRIMPIEAQRAMRGDQVFDVIVGMESDHAPHVSAPEELAEALSRVAAWAYAHRS